MTQNRARNVGLDKSIPGPAPFEVGILPQTIAVFGMGNDAVDYQSDPFEITGSDEVGRRLGFGSPAHLVANALFPKNNDGVKGVRVTVYPTFVPQNPTSTNTPAIGSIVVGGDTSQGGTIQINISTINVPQIKVAAGETATNIAQKIAVAINGVLLSPLIASVDQETVNLTSKWSASTANKIQINFTDLISDVTFTVNQPTGANGRSFSLALSRVGERWETLCINCEDVNDFTVYSEINQWGEGRYDPTVRKPSVFFTGSTEIDACLSASFVTLTSNDRVNSLLIAPGSNTLPFVVAARYCVRIANIANNDPSRNFGGEQVTLVDPGFDGFQPNYATRDKLIKSGSSSCSVNGKTLQIEDVVTFFNPNLSDNFAYQYVSDIVKIQNILYNLDGVFDTPEWSGAPLIPNNQETANPAAKKPRTAVAVLTSLLFGLESLGIITNVTENLSAINVSIDAANPKRLNIDFLCQLSGTTNIVEIGAISKVPELRKIPCELVNIPIFDVIPPNNFAHGYSVRRMREDFAEVGPLVAYKVNTGETATIPFDSDGEYADVNWLRNWLNGSVGLVTYAFDQAPAGRLPNGDPAPPLDLEQLDVNRMPRLTDDNGNVHTNASGVLELEFRRPNEGNTDGRFLRSNSFDYGPPAGSVRTVLATFAGRKTAQEDPNRIGLLQEPGAWRLGTNYSFSTNKERFEWRTDGSIVSLDQDFPALNPFVVTGAVSDSLEKIIMANGSLAVSPRTDQRWGISRLIMGGVGNRRWTGFMQEASMYFADDSIVTTEYLSSSVTRVQQSIALSLGFTI